MGSIATLVIYGGLALSVIGTLGYAYYSFTEKHFKLGVASVKPTIDKMKAQLDADTAAFNTITTSFAAVKAAGKRRDEALVLAELANKNRRTVEVKRIEYIDRIVPTGDTECLKTSDAIKKVLR